MIAAVLFAAAAVLWVGPSPETQLRRLKAVPLPRSRPGWLVPAVLACCGSGIVWVSLGPRVLGWAVTVAVLLSTATWVVRRMRADRRRAHVRADTARAAKTLALLLRAGQIPTHALDDAALDCPALASVASTGRLGGDVAAAFNALSVNSGSGGYRRVAAAWTVSERTGAPIALVLGRVAENLRRERHLAAVVAAELAAARASGRIMALLPFVAIALGSLVGAQPLQFLFGSWLGQLAFLGGTVLVGAGVVWTELIARSGEPVEVQR